MANEPNREVVYKTNAGERENERIAVLLAAAVARLAAVQSTPSGQVDFDATSPVTTTRPTHAREHRSCR